MHTTIHLYECLLLFDSGKYHSEREKLLQQIHQVLERRGAKIEASRGADYVFPQVRAAITDAYRRASISGPESLDARSEERRVGKECRSRWSPYH